MSLWVKVSQDQIRRERAKARELKRTSWWKQRVGKGVCYHCGEQFPKEELTMDHLRPLARGGKTTKKNVVVSCKRCNVEKGRKTRAERILEEWESSESPNTPGGDDGDGA